MYEVSTVDVYVSNVYSFFTNVLSAISAHSHWTKILNRQKKEENENLSTQNVFLSKFLQQNVVWN